MGTSQRPWADSSLVACDAGALSVPSELSWHGRHFRARRLRSPRHGRACAPRRARAPRARSKECCFLARRASGSPAPRAPRRRAASALAVDVRGSNASLCFLTGDITTFSSGSHQPQSTYASGGGDRGDRGAMSTGTARRGQAVDLASPGERGWKDGTCARFLVNYYGQRGPPALLTSARHRSHLPAGWPSRVGVRFHDRYCGLRVLTSVHAAGTSTAATCPPAPSPAPP